jgi:hypothetical protein
MTKRRKKTLEWRGQYGPHATVFWTFSAFSVSWGFSEVIIYMYSKEYRDKFLNQFQGCKGFWLVNCVKNWIFCFFWYKVLSQEELFLADETKLPNAMEQNMKMPNSADKTNLPVLVEQNCRTWRNKQNWRTWQNKLNCRTRRNKQNCRTWQIKTKLPDLVAK